MAATAKAAEPAEVVDEKRGGAPAAIQRFADDDLVPRMMIPVAEAKRRLHELQEFVREVMQDGVHYGPPFPGSDKSVLYKAGGELLMEVYGYAVDVAVTDKIEQWTAAEGGPFFHYQVEARIYSKRTGNFVGRGIGSCNSRENRYRWRTGQRVCPACGSEAIIKGKAEYGGGWLCYKAKGGCGAKFADNATEITDQQVGKVPNDDVESLVNTVLKIAKKRAYLDGAITVTQSSGIFMIEDDSPEGDDEGHGGGSAGTQQRRPAASKGRTQQRPAAAANGGAKKKEPQPTEARPNKILIRGKTYYTAGINAESLLQAWDLARRADQEIGENASKDALREVIGVDTSLDLNQEMAVRYLAHLRDMLGEGDANDEPADPEY